MANVHVRYESAEGRHDAALRRIGFDSVVLDASECPEIGTSIAVCLQRRSEAEILILPAVVQWITLRGFGAKLGLLGARQTHALSEIIAAASRPDETRPEQVRVRRAF